MYEMAQSAVNAAWTNWKVFFLVRFKDLFLSYKYQNQNSRFFSTPTNKMKSLDRGPLEDIVEVVQVANTSRFMDVLEKINIYGESQMSDHINDTST